MLVVVFLVALVTRAGWGTYRLQSSRDASALEFPDEQQYWRMASSLRNGQGLRDEFDFRATRMPLYPASLALAGEGPRGVVVAKMTQWIIGAAAAALTAGLAAAVLSPGAGWLAGLIVAFDPFLIFFSSLLLTETSATTALVGLWWASWPVIASSGSAFSTRRSIGLGLLSAVSIYLRESTVGLVMLLLAVLFWHHRRNRSAVLRGVLMLLVLAASLAPWAIRNRLVTGHWVLLTTRGGVSLYDGVRPDADGGSNLVGIQDAPELTSLNELAWNRHFLRASGEAIRSDPGRVLHLAWLKVQRLWNPFPNVGSYQSPAFRAIAATWMIPCYVLAVAGTLFLSRIRRGDGVRVVLFMLLPALYLTVIHCLFVGSVRYRVPATPMLAVLAAGALAAGASRLWEARRSDQRRPRPPGP